MAVPYIRFLHPEIVHALVEDNEARKNAWALALDERGIDHTLYLWERSPCAFPGVRRYAGSAEIAQYRRQQETKARPDNALALDDNSYPKEIWSFIFRGKRFQNSGPEGYSLAHLADHKKYKSRIGEEFNVDIHTNLLKPVFGLYTSPANTAYVPTSLIRPTDFSFHLRNLIQRKADDLYGRYCYLLPVHLSVRVAAGDQWDLDSFNWSAPVGTTCGITSFLNYRREKMERLLAGSPVKHVGR